MSAKLLIVFLCFFTFSWAQAQKSLTALPIQTTIKIDGVLDELEWEKANSATDFTQTSPVAGQSASQKTEVKFLYDNSAIYIAAVLYDVSQDSITQTLSNRDDFGNADYFGVIIDTYGSSTIGFGYLVTSAGVQIDELHTSSSIDRNWNAAWYSKVKIHDNKWIVEMKIPLSSIRFPNQDIQNWRINFNRSTRRNREDSYWNYNDPKGFNFLSQFGELTGVKGIKSPLRLSVSPYVSGYVENYDGTTNTTFNGGMDLKYGINDAFTIDMTLIPDFGQVQFDEQVLNLSPFEVRYNENRQFFTEGTELFNKVGIFYSRRIGSEPINRNNTNEGQNEIVISNPSVTPLLNATKLSGRTKSGLGIGIFNGITRATYASILDTVTQSTRSFKTNPIANYNVIVLDQNLKNNSTITFTNTSVWRAGKTYDANVSALSFDLYNKKGSYNVFGNINLSQKYDTQNEFGYRTDLTFDKSSGNFKFGLDMSIADKKYNINDLGFLYRNNFQNYTADFFYNTYKPFWKIFKSWYGLAFNYSKLNTPNVYTNSSIKSNFGATFKNFLTAGGWAGYYFDNYDYFEPRIDGRYFVIPKAIDGGIFISTNYAKAFALDVNLNTTQFVTNRKSYSTRISSRFRFSDKLTLIYAFSLNQSIKEQGLALTNYYSTLSFNNDPIFGERNRQNIENSIQANYIFTNRMGITFKLRHYWAKVDYESFYYLNQNGSLSPLGSYLGLNDDGSSKHNTNFNAFTIDMVYKWVFAQASELSLVWKNSIFSSSNQTDFTYFQNTQNLSQLPATNSISFKLLYYLDYYQVFNRNKNQD